MRLTIKDKEIRNNFNAEYAKLADLEDIEDELGIEIITLFKALKNGLYYKVLYSNIKAHKVDEYVCYTDYVYCYYDADDIHSYVIATTRDNFCFNDYGKTWALTKEELL